MTTLNVNTITPAGNTLTLGASGDSVVIGDNDIRVNTVKDAGGNTLWVSNGSGVLSSVNAAFDGSLKLITTTTVSDQASLSFTSGISSTYKEYIFKFINMNPATDSAFFQFQVSTNAGSSYGMTITSAAFVASRAEAAGNGYIEYVTAADLQSSTSYQPLGLYTGSDADEAISGELHLFNPSSTTYVKNFYSTGNLYSSSIYTRNPFISGYIDSTSDVDAINFKFSTGNITAGTIQMYGVV